MIKQWLFYGVELLHSIRDKNLQWRERNQAKLHALTEQRLLAEQALTAQLNQKNQQLAHQLHLLQTEQQSELNQLKLTQNAQLTMLKTKCAQDIKDYQQYLQSLEQLKRSIQLSYQHLPEAVAFTIHHHAKYLLNEMWNAPNLEEKLRQEINFINFMTAVHQDAQLQLRDKNPQSLPNNTLRLLEKNAAEQS